MKKHLAFVLLALMLSVCLIACTGDASVPGDDTTATTAAAETTLPAETEPDPPADIVLVSDGTAPYSVVRGEFAAQNEVDAAIAVYSAIGNLTGVQPTLTTDWVKPGAERDHTAPEILVGSTGHTESAEALRDLPYGDYIVKTVGSKLVINAWSAQGLADAATAFTRAISPLAQNGQLILPADFTLTGTSIEAASSLPFYDGGNLETIYHAGDNNQLFLIGDTTPEAYAAYRKALESAGFTLYAENEIKENRFATYVNDTHVINAGYYAYEKAARVILEPRTVLPGLPEDNKYEKIVSPSLTMIGLEHDETEEKKFQNGMSFVFQLSDGSYIIIDGGFNRSRDSAELYQYLRSNAPDPDNVTIAAWIMTHAHGDHTGCFYSFSESAYARKVKLELVVGNFPSDEARHLLGTEGSGGAKVMRYAREKFNADFLKVHVGQKLYIRDAEIEMLYTLESFSPRELTYFNTTSLIFSVKIAGQSFVFYGDASNDAMSISAKMYGDYLKCDFAQASHHGAGTGSSAYGGVVNCYNYSAPTFVLWPSGSRAYDAYHDLARNKPLEDQASIQEIFVATNRIIKIPLPYTVGTSGAETILKVQQ
ncbi:MAG: MBL fold metallo-hydrolase [Clostridia bacterium]|nr:MBL fold metallo-hydrolase [Clostridia bacterium]